MSKPPPNIRIQIVSDTVWPWCFIGKRRLEDAIKATVNTAESDKTTSTTDMVPKIETIWRPFQLNPNSPYRQGSNQGTDKYQYYISKFGQQRTDKMLPHMKGVGKGHGINFSYGGNTGNTFDSHRLILLAENEGGAELQNKVVEELFKNYFEQEKFLGDLKVLEECAIKCGISRDSWNKIKNEENYLKQETLEQLDMGRRMGVNGVPFFIVNDKYALEGAQDKEAFLEVFGKLGVMGKK